MYITFEMVSKLEYAYNRYLAGWKYAYTVEQQKSSSKEYQQYLRGIQILDLIEFEYYITHYQEFAEVFGNDCTEFLTLEEQIMIWINSEKPNRDVIDYFYDLSTKYEKEEFLRLREVAIKKIIN